MKIFIVSHTHWDREWYKPSQYFNTKLAYFFTELFTTLDNDKYSYFMLDGQMVMLEDYLQLYPQNKEKIAKYVRDKKLVIGPWYTQTDEFNPDAESIVRNLLLGINMAKEYGPYMKVGYLPDSFGHNAQIPQILKGFGIDYACVMRGIPLENIRQHAFYWEGLNKEKVTTVALSTGYSNGMFLPSDKTEFLKRIQYEVTKLKKINDANFFLIMDGVDHQFPFAKLPEMVKKTNSKDIDLQHTTLENYLALFKDKRLDCINSELITPVSHRVHKSSASTRMYQKKLNRISENLLEKQVEPLCLMTWFFGGNYPKELINNTWKTLLKNQIHDSICGCCTDEVHVEISSRYANIITTAKTLIKAHSRAIATSLKNDKLTLTIYNTTLVKGKNFVKATIYTNKKYFDLYDRQEKKIDYVVEEQNYVDASAFSIWSFYLDTPCMVYKTDIYFECNLDFNLGYYTLDIIERSNNLLIKKALKLETTLIENNYYKIKFNKNGTFDVLDKTTMINYPGLNAIEDVADEGDTYNFSPIINEPIFTNESIKNYSLNITEDKFKTKAIIKYQQLVPKKLLKNKNRSKTLVKQNVLVEVILYKNSKRIDVKTEVDNQALDHRIRLLFPFPYKVSDSYAMDKFGTIKRPTKVQQGKNWSEEVLPTYSQQRFVNIHNFKAGLTILNKDLTEYEVYETKENKSTLALTLVRGVGVLGKANLNIRKGRPSGMPILTPDAQCLGIVSAKYSLLTHGKIYDEVFIANETERFSALLIAVQNRIPLTAIQNKYQDFLKLYEIESLQNNIEKKLKNSKPNFNFIELSDDEVVITAIKKAENEEAIILRIYNPSAKKVLPKKIKINANIILVVACNLLEETLSSEVISYSKNEFETLSLTGYTTKTYKIYIEM